MRLEDFFIIADDLTGAVDTGTCFLKKYRDINIFTGIGQYKELSGLNIINTNTRSSNRRQAYSKIRKLFKGIDNRIILKKIDSGFRGNVSIEIKAIDESIDPENIFVIAAIPELNRITSGGYQYINNKKVKEIFGKDPLNNVKTSYIPDIIGCDLDEDIQLVDLKQLRSIDFKISKKVVVFDSESIDDIDLILNNIDLKKRILFVGSLGLFCGLEKLLNEEGIEYKKKLGKIDRVLFICGSREKNSMEQVKYAWDNNLVETIKIDLAKSAGDLFFENLGLFKSNKNILIYIGNCNNITGQDIQDYLASFIGLIFNKTSFKAASVFGGDTLFNICRGLGISKLKVMDKISPAVEVSQGDGKSGKIIIVSKGGSVGETGIIKKILDYFKYNGNGDTK